VQRVGERPGRVEGQAGAFDHALRVPVDPRAVFLLEGAPGNALLRVLRMEEERQPLDLRAEPTLQPLGPREADVAERSGVVAPDRDGEVVHPARLPVEDRAAG
jgi:hypothetical protein